jgi:tellurite resistance protein TehA-like permease
MRGRSGTHIAKAVDSGPATVPRTGFGPDDVRHLDPGYFALVMATGITSTVLRQAGHRLTSTVLLIAGVVGFGVLCVLNVARAVGFSREMADDLAAPDRAFTFFTFVAACNVLGAGFAALGHPDVTLGFAVASAAVWVAMSYGLPARALVRERVGAILGDVNGTWFLWVVATQSLAVAAAMLEPVEASSAEQATALTATLAWSIGVVLYLIVATMVAVRLLVAPVSTEDLGPPYWIAMGATAITVLAAALMLRMRPTPITQASRPAVEALGITLWGFGTWLIPLLVAVSLWRAVSTRRLRYTPAWWSIIFPIGMYAAASVAIGRSEHLPLLRQLGSVAGWVAVGAWTLVSLAMLQALARRITVRRGAAAEAG